MGVVMANYTGAPNKLSDDLRPCVRHKSEATEIRQVKTTQGEEVNDWAPPPSSLGPGGVRIAALLVEQIQRKSRVHERTPHNAPRIRAGLEKKDQRAESKKNQTRRRHVERTSIFFQTTGRHPPGARRETTEVKTRKC